LTPTPIAPLEPGGFTGAAAVEAPVFCCDVVDFRISRTSRFHPTFDSKEKAPPALSPRAFLLRLSSLASEIGDELISSAFPVPFWLPQRPQRNTTFPMNRLAKDLYASGALLFHTKRWTWREAGQQILGQYALPCC
jgi:hypothetical protein